MASLSVFFRLRASGTLSFASFHSVLSSIYSNDVEESSHVCDLFFFLSKLESMCAPQKKPTPGHIVSYPTSEVLK